MVFADTTDGSTPDELSASDARPYEIAVLLTQVMAGFKLTDFERELVLQKMNELNLTISAPRAGKTLGAVVDYVRREKHAGETISLEEVRAALGRNEIQATPKEIYNALGYLTRKKHIENIGYGQYRVSGRGGQ
jgi:hypothetical protein